MESEEVIAAINRRKKKSPPKKCPAGIYSKTPGRAKKPRERELAFSPAEIIDSGPRKINAAGITIIPPRATSKKPLPDAAETELSAMSSSFFVYEA